MGVRPLTRLGLIVVTSILLLAGNVTPSRAQARAEHFGATYAIVDQLIAWDCLGDGERILINGTARRCWRRWRCWSNMRS